MTNKNINEYIQEKRNEIYDIKDPEKLLEFINSNLPISEKAKKERGEVFTPKKTIYDMINELPIDVWINPNLKWLDPASGLGNFSIVIYKKLFEGLSKWEPNEEKRRKHILEKMLYMVEFDKGNVFFMKKILCANKYNLNIFIGSFINHKSYDKSIKVFNGKFNNGKDIKSFDIILGNPPYNDKNGRSPIYNIFIEKALMICNIFLLFIIPSRWFSGGKGLDSFKKMMLNRTDIVLIKHIENASEIFGNEVDIKGGVNYFLINKKYKGLCNFNGSLIKLNNFEILINDYKYYSIIKKLIKFKSINELYKGQHFFNILTDDKRLVSLKRNNNYIKCYVSKKQNLDRIKYINKNLIINNKGEKINYNYFKVISTKASGEGVFDSFGYTQIIEPTNVHSYSYFHFKVKNEKEAKSLLSYLKCILPNFMLSLKKISKDISKETLKWVPLPPLDRLWKNEEVYKYFGLKPNEIKIIEEKKLKGFHNT